MHLPLKNSTSPAEKHITVTLHPTLMREADFSQLGGHTHTHTHTLSQPLVTKHTQHEARDDVILRNRGGGHI